MIPSNRKVSSGLFKDLLVKGRSYHSPDFSIRVFVSGSEKARFSVSVPKKVVKTAVGRNLIKRKVYSVIRGVLGGAAPGVRATISVKRDLSKESLENIKKDIVFLLKKAGAVA